MTVTEDDLLSLDEALQETAIRRKQYPPRISVYRDKICQHASDVAREVKVAKGKEEIEW